ncbi:MAG: F0F1 ATP synthase subunit delta [Parabacteroides sp.]|uniref:F0F1 ATP synthase subunit delta n=1 Tax=Macellibacteroides sp. TaxID=2014584 RepID=UPI003E1E6803
MYIGNISVRYARALLAYAKENKEETQVYDEMQMLLHQMKAMIELVNSLNSPIISQSKKAMLLETACGIDVSNSTSRFIKLVLSQKREDLLRYIILQFIDMYRKENHILPIRLTLAQPIDLETSQRLKELINIKTHDSVEFTVVIDPKQIGGFILDTDGYRLDASVLSQLDSIRSQLIRQNL